MCIFPYYARDNVECKCKKCGKTWTASYVNLSKSKRATGCPYCQESYGEKEIQRLLKELNIEFVSQYRFDDLRDKLPLPLDIYLPKYNIAIEYDGEHHFYPVRFGGVSKEKAKKRYLETIKHDKMKNEYCLLNNIVLIRISYLDRDNIKSVLYSKLTENKVL